MFSAEDIAAWNATPLWAQIYVGWLWLSFIIQLVTWICDPFRDDFIVGWIKWWWAPLTVPLLLIFSRRDG